MKTQRVVIMALALALTWNAGAGAQQTADERYQAGLYQEEVQGNLEQAIEIYQSILSDFPNNRAVGAKAQLHIGLCYEILGVQEAQRAYRQVINNYAEHRAEVAMARQRLAALSQETAAAPATGGPVARMLLNPAENPADRGFDNPRAIIPSPDGRHIAYWQSEPDAQGMYIRNLATRAREQAASGGPTEAFLPPVWSADARQLAFTVTDTATRVSVIRILDLSSREERTLSVPEGRVPYLVDWTRDGRYFLSNDLRGRSLYLVRVSDGAMTTVSDSVWPWQRATFSPDGRHVAYGYGAAPRGPKTVYVQPVTGGPRHEIVTTGGQVYPHPLWSPDGTAIAYQDADGIWVVPMADGMPSGPPRLAYRTESPRWATVWTAAGGLHYTANEQRNVPWRVEVVPSTGRAAGSPAEELAAYPGGVRTFAWSPDGRTVAINGWHNDLTVYSLDSKASTSYEDLEQDGRIYWFTRMWSPDGQELWYEHIPANPDSGHGLKALNLATGQVRELFTLPDAWGISWSADGRTMVFERPGSVRGAAEIVVAEAGQSNGQVVAATPGSDGMPLNRLAPPQLSPRGDKVLYVVQRPPASAARGGAVWVVGADGTGARRVAAAPRVLSATWDPSGRFIAYTGKVEGSANTMLRVVDLESGAEHDIPVPSTESRLHIQDWSQDGRFIGFIKVEFWWEYWAVDNLLGAK